MITTRAHSLLLVILFSIAISPIFLFQLLKHHIHSGQNSMMSVHTQSHRFLNTCKYYKQNPGVIRNAARKAGPDSILSDDITTIFITGSFFHTTRHIANLHSFLQHTSRTYIVSEEHDDDLCITGLPKLEENLFNYHTDHQPHENNGWFVAQRRWWQALELAYKEHPNQQWYIIFDDDSFPNIPLMNKVLPKMITDTPKYYLGYEDWGASGHFFNQKFVKELMENPTLYQGCKDIFLKGRVSSDDAFPRCSKLFAGAPLTLTPMGYDFPTSDEMLYKMSYDDMLNKKMVYSTRFFNEKNPVLYEIVYEKRKDIHEYITGSKVF